MVAAAVQREVVGEPSAEPIPVVVAAQATPAVVEAQERVREAEHSMARAALVGILVGMPICALIWVGLVGLSLALAEVSVDVWVALVMAVVVGMFAGAFLGGWAGVTLTAEHLEEAERGVHVPPP
jgi:hypothetical protein